MAAGISNQQQQHPMDGFEYPPLTNKCGRPHSPVRNIWKTPRTGQEQQHQSQDTPVLIRATNGARVFSNPSRVSHALHASPMGKYIIEGETRSLGNGSALVVALWKSNISKVPGLQESTFTLGERQVICHRTDWKGVGAQ